MTIKNVQPTINKKKLPQIFSDNATGAGTTSNLNGLHKFTSFEPEAIDLNFYGGNLTGS
jgi:hypothetical protein